eukprot:g19840.t1
MENLQEVKQMPPPMYCIRTAGPRWLDTLGRQVERLAFTNGCYDVAELAPHDGDGEVDDGMPTLRTDDDVTNGETDDDGLGDGPMDDAPPDTATYTQADASVTRSDDDDMPNLLCSDDDAVGDLDDNENEEPAAIGRREAPTEQQDSEHAHLVCDDAVAMMAFSPKTLSEVDNLLLDLPTNPAASQEEGKQETGVEAASATEATPTPATTTATPTAQSLAFFSTIDVHLYTSSQSCLHAYLVSKCRACNALCPLFMAQPDPRNWAVSDVLEIHGAFKNSVDLLDIAEKGIGGTLSMTGVLSAVNAGVRPGLLLRVEYDGKESNCIGEAPDEAQPGRGRGQEQVEKEGEGKSKETSVKQERRTKKPTYAFVQVSDNSGEKETEAGNAPSAMAKAKRSRPPFKKVLGNAEQ